jgi:hypothetical protein
LDAERLAAAAQLAQSDQGITRTRRQGPSHHRLSGKVEPFDFEADVERLIEKALAAKAERDGKATQNANAQKPS